MNALDGLTQITQGIREMRADMVSDVDRWANLDRLRMDLAAAYQRLIEHGVYDGVDFIGGIPTRPYLTWLSRFRELCDEHKRAKSALWLATALHEAEIRYDESGDYDAPILRPSDLDRERALDDRDRNLALRDCDGRILRVAE